MIKTNKMKKIFLSLLLGLTSFSTYAQNNVVNVYAWTGEIPDTLVKQFEKESGIKVNFSTYENNEIMYTKIKASKNAGYDVVMPSSYFVDRMRKQNMLLKLDKSKLSNWANLNPEFLNPSYDPGTQYSTPYIWGVTGIFVNKKFVNPNSVTSWSNLWQPRFNNQLMLLDDSREIFSMGLLTLGYPANDTNPTHIQNTFLKLKAILPNVKVFSSETVVSIIIDEDATIGMAWNGDVYKASKENPNVSFIYPKDGFVIWVDNFSIPVNAPHKDAAYAFINFMTRADIAKNAALVTNFPTANLAAQKLLPQSIQQNPSIYPPKSVLKRGQFQTDLGDETLSIYEKYWEQLKISG